MCARWPAASAQEQVECSLGPFRGIGALSHLSCKPHAGMTLLFSLIADYRKPNDTKSLCRIAAQVHREPMFEQVFKNIDDVLWKEAGCTTELDYTEQSSWMLFLKYLDDLEQERALKAELQGKPYEFIIDEPHQWSTWAAPKKEDGSFD